MFGTLCRGFYPRYVQTPNYLTRFSAQEPTAQILVVLA
jgi:hypothetical protein